MSAKTIRAFRQRRAAAQKLQEARRARAYHALRESDHVAAAARHSGEQKAYHLAQAEYHRRQAQCASDELKEAQ